MKSSWLIGIDEAGRGPLAGPVSVGVVKVSQDFDWKLIPGVNDSKQLSEAKREVVFTVAQKLKASGQLDFAVAMVSASVIDRIGIVPSIKLAMKRALKKIDAYSTVNRTLVKLDGSLVAPSEFLHQETIIKGDSKEKVIGLASIMAKVTRDRYMVRIAKKYPEYGLEIHKGYGTKMHREAIKKYKISCLHRKSFCRNSTFSWMEN